METAHAQERAGDNPRISPNAAVSQTIGTTVVSVTYGRPGVREREIFGDLVPLGEVWRTGADEATTITFSNDVTFEGEPVPAGTYSLFTIPQEEEATIVLNSVADQWGAYEYDESQDVLRVDVTPENVRHMEQLMFYFTDVSEEGGTLVIHWDAWQVSARIEPASD